MLYRTVTASDVRRAVALGFMCLAVCSCSDTKIPRVIGTVINIADQQPVSDAVVVATFTGHTRARDLWFLAHSGFDRDHCFRVVVRTNDDGDFAIRSNQLASYFGSPEWRVFVYKKGFRSALSGDRYEGNWIKLKMWPEKAAEEIDSFTGEKLNYEAISEPESFRKRQQNRARYLDDLLDHGITFNCEFEGSVKERDKLVLDLFREWRSLGGPYLNHGRSLACDVLTSFQPGRERVAEFDSLRAQIKQECVAAKHQI